MTDEQQFILGLIRKSVAGDDITGMLQAEDAESAAGIIRRNGILLTVFPAIMGLEAENESVHQLYSVLLPYYTREFRHAYSLIHEGETVLTALSDAGLDCIALKGWELRKLYPEGVLRQMTDLDILIRPYNFKKLRDAMERIGFACVNQSAWKHDNFRKDKVTVEMHKRLTDDSGAIGEWEKRMWDRSVPDHDHIFRMTQEDFYIYHLIHMRKDFRNGHLGLRRIIDTWLLKNLPMDRAFVRAELTNLGLGPFQAKMEKLADVVMGREEPDENCEILLRHAFRYGIYGSAKAYKAGRIAAMSHEQGLRRGKLNSLFSAVFLPPNRMKAQYPGLRKAPVLLPYYWAKRIFHFAFHDSLKKRIRMLDYSSVSEEDYNEMKSFLKAGE